MVQWVMNAKSVIAYNIKRLMKERGCSQADLARAVNKEPLTVHHYIKEMRFPKPENMDAICEYFKVPLTELFKLESDESKEEEALRLIAKPFGYEIIKKS